MNKFRWIMGLLLLFLTSCAIQTAQTIPADPGVSVSPLMPFQSPVETVPIDSVPWIVPTPLSDMAVVVGQIIDGHTQLPPLETVMFLGNVDSLDTGQPVVSVDRDKSPFAGLTQDGHFVFAEVIPGEYGLVLRTPDISFLIDDQDGKSLVFTVEAGQVLDLGEIQIAIPQTK